MQRLHRIFALLALGALIEVSTAPTPRRALSGGPEPKPVRLSWADMNVLILPSSFIGTQVWFASRPDLRHPATSSQMFITEFDPAVVPQWANDARAFLDLQLRDSDTGNVRSSTSLNAEYGNASLTLVRRRREGKWTNEWLLLLQALTAEKPWVILASQQVARVFVDSLAAVASRSKIAEDPSDTIPRANPFLVESGPRPDSRNKPPPYPEPLRLARIEGEVWANFTVSADGKADPSSLRVILSDDPLFVGAVRDQMRRWRYEPARRNGIPISMKVFQQISFRLTQP